MSDLTLTRLLDAAADLGPEYGHGLASHLPMALAALHDLGADGRRLQAFFDRYRHETGLVSAPGVAAPRSAAGAARADAGAEPQLALGRWEDGPRWRQAIARALALEGRDAVLRRLLPLLMPGVAGAAFHGLIRTAHAVQSGHTGELAAALAYWSARWLPMPMPPSAPGHGPGGGRGGRVGDGGCAGDTDGGADRWIRTLAAAPAVQGLDGRMIADRVAQIATHPAFQPWSGALPVDDDWPARWARAAAQRYVSSGSFTVLHLVTATHAFRVLSPWMSPDGAGEREQFGRAWAAAWLSARTDPDAPDRADPGLDWPAIRARARDSDDDHVIKLVWSAWAEARHHGGDVWRHAAALAVVHGT